MWKEIELFPKEFDFQIMECLRNLIVEDLVLLENSKSFPIKLTEKIEKNLLELYSLAAETQDMEYYREAMGLECRYEGTLQYLKINGIQP